MTSVDDAVRLVREHTPEVAPALLSLGECAGRILRAAVTAETDLPRTDRSTMDGFAVRADDPNARAWRVVRHAATDDAGVTDLAPGEAVRVATGTAITTPRPVRIIPVEVTTTDADGTLRCEKLPSRDHLHRRGADARAGETLLAPGAPLSPGACAILASLGHNRAAVSAPLRIRHVTTGDEIVPPGSPLPPGGVYDSNGPLIAALLAALGESASHRHLREDYAPALATLRTDLATAPCDLLLISGGAGPGTGDFTEKLLRELGYTVVVRGGVNVRPGKPLIFGVKPDGVAFGLPGNPLSHWASFHTFVRPAIARLRGEMLRSQEIRATLANDPGDLADARPTNHPAQLYWENGEARVRLHPWSASGNVRVMADANALVHLPAGTPAPRPGDSLVVRLVGPIH